MLMYWLPPSNLRISNRGVQIPHPLVLPISGRIERMFMYKEVKVPKWGRATEQPDLLGRPRPGYDPTGQHTLPNVRRWLSIQNTPGSFPSVLMWDTLTLSNDEDRAR